jgi:hypothetical protein
MLPESYDMPYRYSPALPSMTKAVVSKYEAVISASAEAVTALGDLAISLGTFHAEIAVLRSISGQRTPWLADIRSPGPMLPAADIRPGHVARALRDLGIHEPALLARAAGIDDAAQDLFHEATARYQRREVALASASQSGGATQPRHHPVHVATRDASPTTRALGLYVNPSANGAEATLAEQNRTRRRY